MARYSCRGVAAGRARQLGLGTLLFGARAQVVRGALAKADAASYIRGLLIGSEIADALAVYPTVRDGVIPLIGNRALCQSVCERARRGRSVQRVDRLARSLSARLPRAARDASWLSHAPTVRLICDARVVIGESPAWHERSRALDRSGVAATAERRRRTGSSQSIADGVRQCGRSPHRPMERSPERSTIASAPSPDPAKSAQVRRRRSIPVAASTT